MSNYSYKQIPLTEVPASKLCFRNVNKFLQVLQVQHFIICTRYYFSYTSRHLSEENLKYFFDFSRFEEYFSLSIYLMRPFISILESCNRKVNRVFINLFFGVIISAICSNNFGFLFFCGKLSRQQETGRTTLVLSTTKRPKPLSREWPVLLTKLLAFSSILSELRSFLLCSTSLFK